MICDALFIRVILLNGMPSLNLFKKIWNFFYEKTKVKTEYL